MKQEDIIFWLKNGKPYAKGLELFLFFAGKNIIYSILIKGETPFNRKKLEAELEKHITNLVVDPGPAQEIEQPPEDGIDFFNLSVDLQKKFFEKSELYKKGAYAHRKLASITGTEKAESHSITRITFSGAAAATRDADIRTVALSMKKNGELWRELDYFQTHGQEKAGAKNKVAHLDTDAFTDADIVQLRIRLQNWLRKAKSRLKKLDEGPRKINLQAALTLKEIEFIAVDEKYKIWQASN